MEDYGHYARGEAAAVLPTVPDRSGPAPCLVAAFVREHAERFC